MLHCVHVRFDRRAKGVEMTHEHYCATAFNLPDYMPELLHDKKNTVLLFLPQAHSFARASTTSA